MDSENPRLIESATDERAAIMGILQEQGAKLVELAGHIAEHGLSPIDFPLVYPTEDGKYIIAEGNRRIAALKILHDPTIISGADPKWTKKFTAIAAAAAELQKSVLCVMLQSEAERVLWVSLRHTGENQGRGLSEWNAKEKARFMARHSQERTTRMEFGLQVVELVRSRCNLSPEDEAALRRIPITTLERMLGDPEVRRALGIERSPNGVIFVVSDEAAVINALKAMVLQIARREVKVGQMMSKGDRAARVAEWSDERKPGKSGEPAPARLIKLSATITPPAPASPPLASPAGKRPVMPRSPDQRKVLIPPAFTLKITDQKIRRIFIELKKLDVEEYENAVAVLLRVFLELSVESFLIANKVAFHDHDKLRSKMEKVGAYWRDNKMLSKNQLIPWGNAAGSTSLFSLNVLHAHVHSLHSIPKKRDLLRTWDEMEVFFKHLWP